MIITDSRQLRELTGSFYANNDFTKIAAIIVVVEAEVARTIGLKDLSVLDGDAALYVRQAVAYMATMRFYRLNDLSHEGSGRKAKIDKENEGRPFEWQLARDDRAHLEEYYRALDLLVDALQDNAEYQLTTQYLRQQALIVRDADSLAFLTGLEPSPWLYQRLLPFLWESQQHVRRQYGDGWSGLLDAITNADTVSGGFPAGTAADAADAAQRAVALGALIHMARRTALQALPYGLMQAVESDGGGNTRQQPTPDALDHYLRHLEREQRYWTGEMRRLRDELAGAEQYQHLQVPDNSDAQRKYFRF